MSNKVIDPKLEKRLREFGINIDVARRCLEKFCNAGQRRPAHGTVEPGAPSTGARPVAAKSMPEIDPAMLQELQAMVAQLLVEREVAEPTIFATRPEQKAVEFKAPADEKIEPVPEKDFYTRPMAGKGKSPRDKK